MGGLIGVSGAQVQIEGASAIVGVAIVAALTSALGIRVQFWSERLLGSRRTVCLFVALVALSGGIAGGIAALRPLGLAALGLAAPIPLWNRGGRNDLRQQAGVLEQLKAVPSLLARALETALWDDGEKFRRPIVAALAGNGDLAGELHESFSIASTAFWRTRRNGECGEAS